MSIVGDAWVVIRAITKNLNKDISDGLNDAAKDAEAAGNRAGAAFAGGLGDQVNEDLKDVLPDAIDDAADEADRRAGRRGRGIGAKLGSTLLSGLSGALSGLASLTGLFSMVIGLTGLIGGLISALGALAVGAVAVTAALGPALAAIGVVGIAGIGALVAAAGVGIGIFSQLTSELNANAPIVKEIKKNWSFMKDEFGATFREVANSTVFPELNDVLETLSFSAKGLSGGIFPIFRRGIEEIGTSIAGVLTKFHDLLHDEMFQGGLESAFSSFAVLTDAFGSVMIDLIAVFVHLIAAAKPAIDMFAGWFKGWGENLRTMVEAGIETGKLGAFMEKAAAKGSQFFDTMKNVWDILKNVFKAASPLGSVFLDNFQQSSQALADFTSTAAGSEKLFDFFKPGGQVHQNISAVWDLIKELGDSIKELAAAEGLDDLANGIQRLLPGVVVILESAIGALGAFGKALGDQMGTPAVRAGLKAVTDGFADLGDAFAELAPALGPLLHIIGDLGSNLSRVLGPAFRLISDTLPELIEPLDRVGRALSDVLGETIEAIVPLIPPLVEIIASLAEGLSGPLATAIGAAGVGLRPLIEALAWLLDLLEPILPLIVSIGSAFMLWRSLSTIGGTLRSMGGFMNFAAGAGGRLTGAVGAAGTAMAGLGRALPVIGIAVAGLSMAFEAQDEKIQLWAEALGQGGQAAAQAQAQMANPSFWDKFLFNLTHWGNTEEVATASSREATAALNEKLRSMAPLELAQSQLNRATEDYNYSLDELGPRADSTISAKQRIEYWTAKEAVASYNAQIANEDYASAAQSVADAIWGKIDAEMAAADTQVQTEQAAIRMAEAYQRMIDIQNDPNADPLERRDAELAYQSALNTTTSSLKTNAVAFSEAALKSGEFNSAAEAQAFSLLGQAKQYEDLASTVDGPYKDALLQAAQIARDQAAETFSIEVDANGAIAGLDSFANHMASLDTTFDTEIFVNGTDAASLQVGNITDSLLRFTEIVPAQEVDVVTDAADAAIQEVLTGLNDIDGSTPTASVKAQVDQARTNIRNVLTDMLTVDGQEPTTEVIAYVDEAMAGLDGVMAGMLEANGVTAIPQVLLGDEGFIGPVQDVKDALGEVDETSAMPSLGLEDQQFIGRYGSAVGGMSFLSGLKAIPGLDLEPTEFNKKYGLANAGLATLDGRVATPDATLNSAAFNAGVGDNNAKLTALNKRKATAQADINYQAASKSQLTIMKYMDAIGSRVEAPTVRVNDQASSAVNAIQARLNALQNKTITVTTISKSANARAGGGLVDSDEWSVVGEEGREMVFLSQGQYVATYQKAQKILAAASIQAAGAAARGGGTTTLTPVPVAGGGSVTVPITVNPSAQMDELDLARKTGREFAFQYRKIS